MVVDRPPTDAPTPDGGLLLTAVPGRCESNVSDRCPPKPEDMVKPNIMTGRKFYVVTFSRKVGITNLM